MKNNAVGAKQITIWECKCERCGWEWISRKQQKPVVCSKCHSPYWETKRTRTGKEPAQKQKREKSE